MAWLGKKKLAFIPLYRNNIDSVPTDWADLIMARLFFLKDAASGTDKSVRSFLHTVSSGLADIDVVIQPVQSITGENILPNALEAAQGARLRAEGFDGAAIVMLGGPCGSTSGYWSRFCMPDPPTTWVSELVHQTGLCNLPDLFDNTNNYPDQNMGCFDQETGYCGTHFCAWTKRALGWLDPAAVALHDGLESTYILHPISLVQPPPTGRIAALQIGQQVPYLMVEARLRADQFDVVIPSEGVIVYQVQTSDPLGNAQNGLPPLNLLTKTALAVGQSFTAGDGTTIQVNSSVSGGFFITVNKKIPNGATVPDVTNDTEKNAKAILVKAGFVPVFFVPPKYAGTPVANLWVFSQSPFAGTSAVLGSKVTLTMSGETQR